MQQYDLDNPENPAAASGYHGTFLKQFKDHCSLNKNTAIIMPLSHDLSKKPYTLAQYFIQHATGTSARTI
jgi:hypothetical protein